MMGEGDEMVIDTEAWRAEALAYITGAPLTNATKNTRTLQERIYHLVCALEETERHLSREMDVSRLMEEQAR
jgi:hypothetical protein